MHPSTLAHANGFRLGQMGYAVSRFDSLIHACSLHGRYV
jgi:hypothetical protein